MLLLLTSFFLFATLLFYAVLSFPAMKKIHIEKRVNVYFYDSRQVTLSELEEEMPPFKQRILQPIWKKAKHYSQKKLTNEKASRLEERLLQAGRPFGLSPVEFKLIQTSLVVLLPLGAVGYSFLLHSTPLISLLLVAGALVAAVQGPRSYLNVKIQKRMNWALKELPDTLDLLTISLEAGLGFDAALSKVTAKRAGVLPDEFKLCLEEIRLGKTRKEALLGINQRLPLEEMRGLVISIIQAERLGIGMVTVLKSQTEDIREKRKQVAEEKAMKAPIKMLFPLVLFIFPTLFIVLLGPAVLQFLEAF